MTVAKRSAPPTSARNVARAAAIVLGYLVSFGAASGAVWVRNFAFTEQDQLAMSGMLAFGDAIVFLAVGSFVALGPTLLLFAAIGASPRFWAAYTGLSVLIGSTGVVCAVAFVTPFSLGAAFDAFRGLSVLRLLATPFLLLAAAPGLLPVARTARKRALVACGCEVVAGATLVCWLLVQFARSA